MRAPLPQLPAGPVKINLQISLGKTNAVPPRKVAWSPLLMSMDERARIGSREDDVIGACDIRPLQWTNRLKCERKSCAKMLGYLR